MPTVADVAAYLEQFAPPRLAAEWDNVGLLVGDRAAPVRRLMTCLTVTPRSAAEAIEQHADLIVTHHPVPFRPIKRLTSDTPEGHMLLKLIAANVAIYSPHTAFDSAPEGINHRLAQGLGLTGSAPLISLGAEADQLGVGAGRFGHLSPAITLAELAERLKKLLGIEMVGAVGPADRRIDTVAVGCGSAGEYLGEARRRGCQCLVIGETRFHTCLEAEALDMTLLLAGHHASERFAVEALAEVLAGQFGEVSIWASREERDPLYQM